MFLYQFKFVPQVSPKQIYFSTRSILYYYYDIIDVERKGVLNFIWHLKGDIFGFIFV